MVEIIMGIAMSIIAELSKKTGISQTYLIGLLCLISGGFYVFINKTNPDVYTNAAEFVTKSFATSQAIYMAINKLIKK